MNTEKKSKLTEANNFWQENYIENINKKLNENEEIKEQFSAMLHYKNLAKNSGIALITLTNYRLMILQIYKDEEQFADIKLNKITGVNLKKGILFNTIIINSNYGSFRLGIKRKASLPIFVSLDKVLNK